MRPAIPAYAFMMLVLTATYLAVEVAFAGYLVDVLSGSLSHKDIESIEIFGKLLSGVAVVIAVWGRYAANGESVAERKTSGAFVVAALVSMVVVYGSLTAINKAIVEFSSAEFRQRAYQATFARSVLAKAGEGSPSLIAVAPALFMGDRPFAEVTGKSIDDVALIGTQAAMGSPGRFRAEFFSAFDLDRHFAKYQEGVNEYYLEKAKVPFRKKKEWAEMKARQWKNSVPDTPGMKNAYFARSVVKKIGRKFFKNGEWRTTDHKAFERAIELRANEEIEREYRTRVLSAAGGYLKPGLSKEAFVMSNVIQGKIRRKLRLDNLAIKLTPSMSESAFREHVYDAVVYKEVVYVIRRMEAAPRHFRDGGQLQQEGKHAVSAVVVPTLAVILSLLGSLFHLAKVSAYLHMIAGGLVVRKRLPMGIRNVSAMFTSLLVIAALGVEHAKNAPVSAQTFFSTPDHGFASTTLHGVLRASVGAMDAVYPVTKAARENGPFVFVSGVLPKPDAFVRVAESEKTGVVRVGGVGKPRPKPNLVWKPTERLAVNAPSPKPERGGRPSS